jgi:hypothetical protein
MAWCWRISARGASGACDGACQRTSTRDGVVLAHIRQRRLRRVRRRVSAHIHTRWRGVSAYPPEAPRARATACVGVCRQASTRGASGARDGVCRRASARGASGARDGVCRRASARGASGARDGVCRRASARGASGAWCWHIGASGARDGVYPPEATRRARRCVLAHESVCLRISARGASSARDGVVSPASLAMPPKASSARIDSGARDVMCLQASARAYLQGRPATKCVQASAGDHCLCAREAPYSPLPSSSAAQGTLHSRSVLLLVAHEGDYLYGSRQHAAESGFVPSTILMLKRLQCSSSSS